MQGRILVIGAGHAAVQLCASLAEAGQGHRVCVVSEEAEWPYQRPPLSKSFLKQPAEQAQPLRAGPWFEQAGIEFVLGDAARALDRIGRTVTLASGRMIGYEQLVIATGTRARALPGWPQDLANVRSLRSASDARALRQDLAGVRSVTILGGGFIGLEVAATCAALGKQVHVLESGPRLMARAVPPAISSHALEVHRGAGARVDLGVSLGAPRAEGGRLVRVDAASGALDIEYLLLSVGAVPNAELAQAAGLACGSGIEVDEHMRTSDPSILAIGDCASFPWAGRRLRLESIQNAQDQARVAAATLLGQPVAYRPVPWFWSEQGGMRLQMVGLLPDGPCETVRRQGAQPGSFSLFHFEAGRLCCVESVNAAPDYMTARKIMEAGIHPSPRQVADAGVALRSLLQAG